MNDSKDDDIHYHGINDIGDLVDFNFDNINEDAVRQLVFESLDDAEKFYTTYAGVVGFGIRKQGVKRKTADGIIKYREWVCTCEGFRRRPKDDYTKKREAKVVTRYGCIAWFRVAHDRFSGHYSVTKSLSLDIITIYEVTGRGTFQCPTSAC